MPSIKVRRSSKPLMFLSDELHRNVDWFEGCVFFLVYVKFAAKANMLLMRLASWPAAVSVVILKGRV